MKRLTAANFDRAAAFVLTHARPVDRALFAYHFRGGTAEAVLDALAPYQNEGGGFGHGLEPDFRTPASTPVATTVALQFAREVGAAPDHPLVSGAIAYLLAVFDARGAWPNKVAAINEAPHAPWWHYREPARGFEPNPGAEVVGYLNAYADLVPAALLRQVNEMALSHLEQMAEPLEMHDFLCYLRLAQALPRPAASLVLQKLRHGVRQVVALDPAALSGYAARPLMVAPSPASPVAPVLRKELALNLDYEIAHQGEDGSWAPFWSWGQYPEVWARARVEWQGHLTVKMLKSLHDFGRTWVHASHT